MYDKRKIIRFNIPVLFIWSKSPLHRAAEVKCVFIVVTAWETPADAFVGWTMR